MQNLEVRIDGKPVFEFRSPPRPVWPRVGFFGFEGMGGRTYEWIDEWGPLVRPGDLVIVACGVSFDGSGVIAEPNYDYLAEMAVWLNGRGLHAVVRTTGDANVDKIADWIANNPPGAEFRGVMMTYEAAQGSLDFTEPRDDPVLARDEWLRHHAVNRDACHSRNLEFWSIPGGVYLSSWGARLNIPYGEAAAMCDGFVPQFQADAKDGDLFEPRGRDNLTPWERLKAQLYEHRFKGVIMPQAFTVGGTLVNAVTDVDLALRASQHFLRDRVDGVTFQYQINDETNRELAREFLVGLGR